jgi:hypothetical protein
MISAKPTTDPVVTPALVAKHGLTPEEFERITKILGRVFVATLAHGSGIWQRKRT